MAIKKIKKNQKKSIKKVKNPLKKKLAIKKIKKGEKSQKRVVEIGEKKEMELRECSEAEVVKAAMSAKGGNVYLKIDEVGERVKIKAFRGGKEKQCALCKEELKCDAKQFKDVCQGCRTKWFSGGGEVFKFCMGCKQCVEISGYVKGVKKSGPKAKCDKCREQANARYAKMKERQKGEIEIE